MFDNLSEIVHPIENCDDQDREYDTYYDSVHAMSGRQLPYIVTTFDNRNSSQEIRELFSNETATSVDVDPLLTNTSTNIKSSCTSVFSDFQGS